MRMLLTSLALVGALAIAAPLQAADERSRQEAAFEPSPGCKALERGDLDLRVRVAHEASVGLMGSGYVTGFRPGDRLQITAKARSAGSSELGVSISLAGFDRLKTSQLLVRVRDWDEARAMGEAPTVWQDELTIDEATANLVLFSSSTGEGDGSYELVVRCTGHLVS